LKKKWSRFHSIAQYGSVMAIRVHNVHEAGSSPVAVDQSTDPLLVAAQALLDAAARFERLERRLAAIEDAGAPTEKRLTVAQAAEYASVHPETIRRAIREGRLEVAGRAGKTLRLTQAAVDDWLGDSPASPSRSEPSRSVRPRRRKSKTDDLAEAFGVR
jgi:excisionase family DNA binding protein